MKIKEIVVFLLCIPTASDATITAARCKPSDVGPPHVVLGCGSANHSYLPSDIAGKDFPDPTNPVLISPNCPSAHI
jgi:hypothetical protein